MSLKNIEIYQTFVTIVTQITCSRIRIVDNSIESGRLYIM